MGRWSRWLLVRTRWRRCLVQGVGIAAVNAPGSVVISGEQAAVSVDCRCSWPVGAGACIGWRCRMRFIRR